MCLPKPNASFKIPSIHDDLELDCRLYYSRPSERHSKDFGRSFAIVAHPYAPLGGCYDDPVVALMGTTLLQHGFSLMTFNFRSFTSQYEARIATNSSQGRLWLIWTDLVDSQTRTLRLRISLWIDVALHQ